MRLFYFFLILAFIGLNTNAQNTYVPDDNFEQALIDLGYDFGALDNFVPTTNIDMVDWLDVRDKAISDLTGIEDFKALTVLDVSANSLTSLDVSNNTEIALLLCYSNSLTNINTSNNYLLRDLLCYDNNLISLDVSNNSSLITLLADNNSLTSIDVSNNSSLTNFSCDYNSLTSVDISNNNTLKFFSCRTNSLTSLDVSNNGMLEYLSVSSNSLVSLDVSHNISLTHLYCYNNYLNRLSLKNNPFLEYLDCSNNDLIGLNLRNGKNARIVYFNALNNPDLACIQVEDPTYSTANWTSIDPTSIFRKNCSYKTQFPRQTLIDLEKESLSIYPNPVKDVVTISIQTEAYYSILNINGQQLMDGKLKTGDNRLNTSQLRPGLYILNVINDGIPMHKKFIKN